MASKINPKGILKSNLRSKGPNPKGINPGGINNKPTSKPVTSKPVTSTAPRTRAGVSKGNAPGVANKYANKTPLEKKPVVESKPRTRAGVSKGDSQGTASKYANESNTTAALKERADARIAAEKATRERITKSPRVTAQQRLGDKKPAMNPVERRAVKTAEAQAKKAKAARAIKIAKVTKVAKVAGKGAAIVGTVAGLTYGAKKLYDSSTGKKDEKTKPKATEPKVGGNKVTAPKKDAKDNKGKKELKYVVGEPKKDLLPKIKSDKPNWKSGSIANNLNTAVTAIDKGKKTKPSDNFGSVKKTDTKKADTKTEEKKSTSTSTSVSTAKPAVKKAEPVGTLAPKSTTAIASKSLEEAKTVIPAKATTTTTPASTTATTSSTNTTSPTVTGMQPRATIGNKIRGMLNESRERRAGRAASRGNEERSERLKEKISATEKKMMMKKGGVVKSKSKKK